MGKHGPKGYGFSAVLVINSEAINEVNNHFLFLRFLKVALFHFTICLSSIYTVIHLYVFPVLQIYATYQHVPM